MVRGCVRGCVEESGPKTDPLLRSSMQQALFKYEMPRLELKSLATFLSNIVWEGKNGKVIKLSQRSIYKLAHMCATSGKAVKRNILRVWRCPICYKFKVIIGKDSL